VPFAQPTRTEPKELQELARIETFFETVGEIDLEPENPKVLNILLTLFYLAFALAFRTGFALPSIKKRNKPKNQR